jgi:hypothetical protein
MSNSDNALFGSSAAQSLANEKGEKLGVGQWWNVMHLFGELDYLRIQERFVREPLSVEFITTPLFWYYIKRGIAIGVFFASFLVLFRALSLIAANYFSEIYVYPVSLLIIAAFVFQLANWIIYRPIHHTGAHTKAVSLVFHAAVISFITSVAIKFAIFTILPLHANEIYHNLILSNVNFASAWRWIANNVFVDFSIEITAFIVTCSAILTAEFKYLIRLKNMKMNYLTPKKYAQHK